MIVIDPELTKQITVKDFDSFMDHMVSGKFTIILYKEWGSLRSPYFFLAFTIICD